MTYQLPASPAPLSVRQSGQTGSSSPAAADGFADRAGADEFFAVTVPVGSTVLLGSMDQSGGIHEVFLGWDGSGRSHDTSPIATDRADCRTVRLWEDGMQDAPRSLLPTTSATRSEGDAPGNHHKVRVNQPAMDDSVSFRRFHVPWFSGAATSERYVLARPAAVGDRVRVFIEDGLADSTVPEHERLMQTTALIAQLAGDSILPYVENRLGPISDIDDDQCVSILLCRLTDHQTVAPDETPITGCVRASDFDQPGRPFGGDIVYLDASLTKSLELRAVLAHELSHAAVFSMLQRQTASHAPRRRCPGWLNEAIAHVVELEVCPQSPNLQQRFRDFGGRSNCFPIIIPDDQPRMSVRRGAARAAACSFVASVLADYCHDRPQSLLASTGWTKPLEAATGARFGELFRNWSLHLLRADHPRPHYRLSDTKAVSLVGTSFVRFPPAESSGRLSIRCAPTVRLQVTIVDDSRDVH